MKIAIDVSPMQTGHKIRGVGFYTQRLIEALRRVDKRNQYIFFTQGQKLPKVDLVHYPYLDLFFPTLPLLKIVKTVVTIHDVIPLVFPKFFPPGIKGKINFQRQRLALKNVAAVLCDSECSKKDIEKFLEVPREKINVVYLAAGEEFKKRETRDWKPEIRRKYRLPGKFVLYVGDVTRNKNVPSLVKACQEANIPLVIVGKQAVEKNIDRGHPENRDLAWLQDYSSHQPSTINHQPLVTLTGFVPIKDLVKIYNLASVYVQPSFYEGFGLPVLEAMACGTPVVCANTASLPEVGEEVAVYIDPYNVDDIARGILEVLHYNDMYHCKKVKKGLEQAKKFSWERTAKETIKVYEKVGKGAALFTRGYFIS